jgi:diguanylate cyclase (GGDEF)-like protein
MEQPERLVRFDAGSSSAPGSIARTGRVPPGTAALVKRWRERSSPGETLPEDEALRVVEAVLDYLRGAGPEGLEVAGRAWGQAHRSTSEMVERLSDLRVVLGASGVEDPFEMHRALDLVTASATEEVMARVERVSRTDALTGVGNRRAFDETIQGTLSAAARQGHDVTVVAVDLDGLKSINDTAGHAAGDAALISLVRAFYVALRDEDMIFRLGGDEFVIVLPFTSVDAAEALMQRVAGTDAPSFTWGAAGFPGDASEASVLVNVADQDLYRRRGVQRAPLLMARPTQSPSRFEGASRFAKWAWVPAAAVLVVSLIATLVSASSGTHILARGHPRASTSTTKPTARTVSPGRSGASGATGGQTAPSTSSGASSSSGSVPVSQAQPVAYTPPTAIGGSGGTSPSTGNASGNGSGAAGSGSQVGGSGGGGSAPSPPAGNTSGAGLLGTANELLGPIPVVGDGGLLSVVDQLLLGQPSTVAGTITSAAVVSPVVPSDTTSDPTDASSNGEAPQGIFSTVLGGL